MEQDNIYPFTININQKTLNRTEINGIRAFKWHDSLLGVSFVYIIVTMLKFKLRIVCIHLCSNYFEFTTYSI